MLLRFLLFLATLSFWLNGGKRKKHLTPPTTLVYYEFKNSNQELWVLLHGLGSTAVSWKPILSPMLQESSLIIPELSELGGTRSTSATLTISTGVTALISLFEHLQKEYPDKKISLLGISLGGWLALKVALLRPDLVKQLILINPAGYREQEWERIQKLVTLKSLTDVDNFYRALFVQVPWIFKLSRKFFLQVFTTPAVTDFLQQTQEEDTYTDTDLAKLQVSTALVWSEQDGLFTAAVGEKMASAIPKSSFYLVKNCGHAMHWECPNALVDAIQQFRKNARS